jgi:hypothetical protein
MTWTLCIYVVYVVYGNLNLDVLRLRSIKFIVAQRRRRAIRGNRNCWGLMRDDTLSCIERTIHLSLQST